MPSYIVTDPQTGRKLKLTGDSPPTEQELEQIFASSSSGSAQMTSAGGGTPSPQTIPDRTTRATEDLPELFSSGILSGKDPAKVAAFSTLAAVTPDPRELAKIATNLFPEIGVQEDEAGNILLGDNTTGVRAIINKPGLSGTDVGQFVGLGAAFTPAGRAGVGSGFLTGQGLKQSAKGASLAAGTQAGIEGAQAAAGGDIDAINVAAAGALQPVVQAGAERILSPIGRVGRTQLQTETGEISEQAITKIKDIVSSGKPQNEINSAVANELQISGILTPEQAQSFNLFARHNVPPLRANITQRTDDFRELQDAIKKSGPVAERVAQQDERLFEIGREGIDNIGPTTQNIVETNANVFGVVDNVVNKLDDEVFKAYSAAREVAQGQPRVTLDNLTKAISDSRGSEQISGGVISALRGLLKNKGLIRTGRDIDINKRGPRATGEDTRKLTVTESEEIRQFLNRLHESATPEGRKLIREFKNAIDDDVAEAVGEDIFADARQAKIRFQSAIERGRRNKFDKTKGSFLEDVIDNKIPEEKIVGRLTRGRDDDFIAMKRFLLNDAGAEGIQAFNNIKAQVLRDAMDKAVNQAKGENGQAIFNALGFKKALEGLRGTKKYNALFNKDEQKLIDDIIEIGRLRVPPRAVAQGSGPSGFAIEQAKEEVNRAIVKAIPLIGEKAQALVDAVTSSAAARRQLDPLRETRSAVQRTPAQAITEGELIPDLSAAIQSANKTVAGSSPPTNF